MKRTGDQEVRESLHRFGLARDRLSAAVCRATGLASNELQALEHLEEDGPLTQRELADRLGLTTGGMTLLVDRLERAGFLSRHPHPSDRRAVQLQLDPAAAAASAAAAGPLERYHASVAASVERLSAAERDAVAAFLAAAASGAVQAADVLQAQNSDRRSERRLARREQASAERSEP